MDLFVQTMRITTHQGSALIVLDEPERDVLIDTIALVLATKEVDQRVTLPLEMEPMLQTMLRALINGRGRTGHAA